MRGLSLGGRWRHSQFLFRLRQLRLRNTSLVDKDVVGELVADGSIFGAEGLARSDGTTSVTAHSGLSPQTWSSTSFLCLSMPRLHRQPYVDGNTVRFVQRTSSMMAARRFFSRTANKKSDDEEQVEALFSFDSKLDKYWKDPLMNVSKQLSQQWLRQLDTQQCPMGFDSSSEHNLGSVALLDMCREQKRKLLEKILVVRNGENYEAFGVDAILVLEHALDGFSEPKQDKSGQPIPWIYFCKSRIQNVLDRLTAAHYDIAVFEETDAGLPNGNKGRYLKQIVSAALPTYECDDSSTLNVMEDRIRIPCPCVGVLKFEGGYTYIEVDLESKSYRVMEGLTAEAVRCRLKLKPPAHPIWFVPSRKDYENKVYNDKEWGGEGIRKIRISPYPLASVNNQRNATKRYRDEVLDAVLKHFFQDPPSAATFVDRRKQEPTTSFATDPLTMETARQLGIIEDPRFHSLLSCMLKKNEAADVKALVEDWLVAPPPQHVAQAMADLVESFSDEDFGSCPDLKSHALRRLLKQLQSDFTTTDQFKQLHAALTDTYSAICMLHSNVYDSFLTVLDYESGLECRTVPNLSDRLSRVTEEIEAAIVLSGGNEHVDDDNDEMVPARYWEEKEQWLNNGIRLKAAAPDFFEKISEAKLKLRAAVREDLCFAGGKAVEVRTKTGSMLAISEIPKGKEHGSYEKLVDREERVWYTTNSVADCIEDYEDLCAQGESIALQSLNKSLKEGNSMNALKHAVHTMTIWATVYSHATRATEQGWKRVQVNSSSNETESLELHLKNVHPYWKTDATRNTIEMKEMWLLTGPNSSGKSDLMRSTAAVVLLSICGFCAPVGPDSYLDRCEFLFVRGASADVPSEGKSAFGDEMNQMAAFLRYCGKRSLVFVDELCKGTSPDLGVCMSGAIFELMAKRGVTGIFATHLHDILDLPLEGNAKARILFKCMKKEYMLEDGECRDSMALVTAKEAGVPASILNRARDITDLLRSNEASNDDNKN